MFTPVYTSSDDTPTGKGLTKSGGLYIVSVPSIPLAFHRSRQGSKVVGVKAIRKKIPGASDNYNELLKQRMHNAEWKILLSALSAAATAKHISELPRPFAAYLHAIVADLSEAWGIYNVRKYHVYPANFRSFIPSPF